jgi:hypothetical protein
LNGEASSGTKQHEIDFHPVNNQSIKALKKRYNSTKTPKKLLDVLSTHIGGYHRAEPKADYARINSYLIGFKFIFAI